MAIKVKAVERNVSFDKNSEKWAYVLQADLYSKLSQTKVIQEAALRSGINKGATVTLTAEANEGYRFLSWGDGVTENPRTVTAEEDGANYSAIFEKVN